MQIIELTTRLKNGEPLHEDRLLVSSEHRAAPPSPPVYLDLVATDSERTHLEVVAKLHPQQRHHLQKQVFAALDKDAVLSEGNEPAVQIFWLADTRLRRRRRSVR